MTAQERLRATTEGERRRLRADVSSRGEMGIVGVLHARDHLPRASGTEPKSDLITGRHRVAFGGNLALRFCLESADDGVSARSAPNDQGDDSGYWGERFLAECGRLAEAEMVSAHVGGGFMRLVEDTPGSFHAWIATKRSPVGWREREDSDWWAASLARRHGPELDALTAVARALSDDPARDAVYRRIAAVRLESMAHQLRYPPDAVIGGCAVRTYRTVLERLIAWALTERDRGDVASPRSEGALVAEIADAIGVAADEVASAVSAFTLDRESAAYHAAAPGVAAAPLVRIGPDRIVWSVHGLTTEPLLFLTRELRRRDSEGYHNTAHLRETVFRQDLYALFGDKRFVTSPDRIKLRRTDGDVRTDIDAVVFDRKTGTLGLFELKSQDPFARSAAELTRQRDNVLYANRQVGGMLDWLKRHGADEILGRVDGRAAKTFRVQRVLPFVLGRYLVHFGDGQEPDRRAAWGTWPQVLRLLDGQPARATDANPLATLFSRLTNDAPLARLSVGDMPHEIAFGAVRLIVHPSYAAFQASATIDDGLDSR